MDSQPMETDKTLQNFLNTIERLSGADLAAVQQAGKTRSGEKTDEAHREAERQGEEVLRTERMRIGNVGQLRIQARRAENRAKLLEYRRQCGEEAAEAVIERVRSYTRGGGYISDLTEKVRRAVAELGSTGDEIVILLRAEDMPLAATIEHQLGLADGAVRFEQGDFALGGLIVAAGSRRADMTFDTALRQTRERFAEISGMEIPV